jgi:hypothetical protein
LNKPVPAVIRARELAGILSDLAEDLNKMPEDEVSLLKTDSNPGLVAAPPSLSLVVEFDPVTLNPKTTTIASTKRIVRDWKKDHGG